METLERILAAHPFFEGLEPRYLELLTGCAKNVRFEAGERIFREGEAANEFYLVREGKITVEVNTPDREPINIETLGPAGVLGWSWLIAPYHWRFDARALETTRALSLDGACLRRKCEADHDLGYALLTRFTQIMSDRLHATRMQLLHVYDAWQQLIDGRT